ncbi:MAG TPA: glycoside hydrolase family 25 protein [Anaerolineaceae bacterium]|nr:glycoside hydrolase family 25 protein [Anaerolineaceae bacterium]
MILGTDISHWQTNDASNPQHFFDPVIAKEKGVEFAFLRASDGATNDKAFQTFARTFKQAELPFGVYHYARPAGTIYGTALQQADRFWNLIKDTGFTLSPALDLECQGVGLSFTKVFLERIKELSGRTPIIYTSPAFWTGLKDSGNALWAADYPLWIAHYFSSLIFPQYGIPEKVINSTTLPSVPNPWKKKDKMWSIWQFCATGDGEYYGGDYAKHSENKVGLDLDVYHGTLEELLDELGNGTESGEVIQPSEPFPKRVKIISAFLRGRSQPRYFEGISAVIFEKGQILYRTDEEPVYEPASGITWIQVQVPDCPCCGMWISSNPKYIKEI